MHVLGSRRRTICWQPRSLVGPTGTEKLVESIMGPSQQIGGKGAADRAFNKYQNGLPAAGQAVLHRERAWSVGLCLEGEEGTGVRGGGLPRERFGALTQTSIASVACPTAATAAMPSSHLPACACPMWRSPHISFCYWPIAKVCVLWVLGAVCFAQSLDWHLCSRGAMRPSESHRRTCDVSCVWSRRLECCHLECLRALRAVSFAIR